MVIEDYAFGRMTVDGRLYTSDLMILPDGTVSVGWWRRRGHAVGTADLGPILPSRPAILIIGTVASGMMRPDATLADDLAGMGIRMVAIPTAEAVKKFNARDASTPCAAAFHLTC